MDEGVPALA